MTDSMEAIIDSLSSSFRRVPPAAVPAMLDCILASTGSSPSTLFSSLLNAFPSLTEETMEESERLDYEECNYIASFVDALCHLLKKSGANLGSLRSFIWKILIPLVKLIHAYDREILNKVASSFLDVVVETNSWEILEATMVPFFLRVIGLSAGMVRNEELAIYRWATYPAYQSFDDQLTALEFFEGYNGQSSGSDLNRDSIMSQFGSFPLPTSCHILTLILDASLQNKCPVESTPGLTVANGFCPEMFAGNLLWDLCNITLRMLSLSLELRSSAITFLLPFIFKAFVSDRAFKVSVHGQTCTLNRKHFFLKIWKCCRTLFSMGPSERRDAYAVLSLYLSFFSCTDGCQDAIICDGEEAFDLRTEKGFWDDLKRGLVEKEGLVRKQSLHILKTMVRTREENQYTSVVSETISGGKSSVAGGITKRGLWADKEAKSLGVGRLCNSVDHCLNSQQKWGAFFLLYEMLEEYGTHLVDAAWNHQITLLLHSSFPSDNSVNSSSSGFHPNQIDTLSEIFNWSAVLWERGFRHDNPQVRCLIMQSFLGIEWKNFGNLAKLVPEDFVLGPFVQGLNDPVHHKDFGVKGVYCSRTIEGAARFLCQYTGYLNLRKQIAFLNNLAYFAKKHSLGRPGLMALADCIASAACRVRTPNNHEVEWSKDASTDVVQVESAQESSFHNDKADLLDNLRFITESSKQHFNHKYRCQVCEKILDAAASVMSVLDVPLEVLLHFIATLPQEFTDCGGLLRLKVQQWLSGCGEKHATSTCRVSNVQLLKILGDFPKNFVSRHQSVDTFATYDDEDLDAWGFEAERWARVLFLVIKEEQHLDPILMYIQNDGVDVCKWTRHLTCAPLKFLILALSLIQELIVMQEKTGNGGMGGRTKSDLYLPESVGHSRIPKASICLEKFSKMFLSILKELVSFAELPCSIFWSNVVKEEAVLPGSIVGKLGGPSQRRLSTSATTTVLQAITAVKTVASISWWCAQFGNDVILDSALTFLWKTSWKIISSSTCNSETEAEICVAAYEALAYVLKTLVCSFSPLALDLVMENDESLPPETDGKPVVDSFVRAFLQNINNLVAVGSLTRSRRAILLKWKWICLESLLSIPIYARENGVHLVSCNCYFSDATVRWIFRDLVESLENAGEDSVLPMLRSVRLILELFASGKIGAVVSSCDGVDVQMMWQLVRSSWILHVSCNKRRVALIAALLSSVLHYSVFSDERMHEIDYEPGPLKWFVEKILEEGRKSPRTIRLAALHLTGSWLANPITIKYYMKELKLLTLYGSVAFDEDFEAELAENHDARSEVFLLAKSPDQELTEEFVNTELYARVSVAVLFYKLADLADLVGGSINGNITNHAILESGKLFLLELLDSVLNEQDLSKELYKKYSAIHRRKIRAWQMVCILARFVDKDIVQKVTCSLHTSLHRNNLPGVRQYLETFAIHIYLKFPSLVGEELIPLLRSYDMRPQALSSYVFIAANVILHSTDMVQSRHLDELLPPIIPLLTSHHHTLRGFTQLLVYQILHKLLPAMDSIPSETMSLEKRCFQDLKAYLAGNSDCAR
ncbi:unnamed protein product [Ilex paraguariensis]|uniref:Uncharacterized protein n=1 Tax=Ilex paraguariensis TaxID=185542 RepID=A0ABC8TUZ7_9AQUA